jgi:hypothetical protein
MAEVHAVENFGDGEITGQYNLLVIIKQERYSVIEVILKLADAIFGPLFLETGVLFGLTVMSEREWKHRSTLLQACSSEFIRFFNTSASLSASAEVVTTNVTK